MLTRSLSHTPVSPMLWQFGCLSNLLSFPCCPCLPHGSLPSRQPRGSVRSHRYLPHHYSSADVAPYHKLRFGLSLTFPPSIVTAQWCSRTIKTSEEKRLYEAVHTTVFCGGFFPLFVSSPLYSNMVFTKGFCLCDAVFL